MNGLSAGKLVSVALLELPNRPGETCLKFEGPGIPGFDPLGPPG